MFSHLYASADNQLLPFSSYIERCRALVTERRCDLSEKTPEEVERIVEANTPFELRPETRPRYGALLLHGLLNCPFALKEIGLNLQANGVLARSILLPGHGTQPSDLLHITYQDWIDAVQYGVASLREEVDHVFIVGYSTGGTLGVHQAFADTNIAGLILLAPAIKIKPPIDTLVNWQYFIKMLTKQKQWACLEQEIDYVKYQSITFNAVYQVAQLTKKINTLANTQPLECPIFMAMSHEDETICSKSAAHFFLKMPNPYSKLLLYSANGQVAKDPRVTIRPSENQTLRIKSYSHLSVLFSANNPHYGCEGDYVYASNPSNENVVYGAYNAIELDTYNFLHKLKLTKVRRQELTYNPDYDFMSQQIAEFIKSLPLTNL